MNFLKKLFAKKNQAPAKAKIVFANCRWGVITAYFQETLESLPGGMVSPRNGIMVFTDDASMPRTGTRGDLDKLVEQTGRQLQWVSEYAFYTICRGCVSPIEDTKDYGHLVCRSLPTAVAMSANPPR